MFIGSVQPDGSPDDPCFLDLAGPLAIALAQGAIAMDMDLNDALAPARCLMSSSLLARCEQAMSHGRNDRCAVCCSATTGRQRPPSMGPFLNDPKKE
jgi:hypothetical protein